MISHAERFAVAQVHAKRLVAGVQADPSKRESTSTWGAYLQRCETALIDYLNGTPPPPQPGVEIEFGFALYWLDTTLEPWEQELLGLPPTQITTPQYNAWLTAIESAPASSRGTAR